VVIEGAEPHRAVETRARASGEKASLALGVLESADAMVLCRPSDLDAIFAAAAARGSFAPHGLGNRESSII